MARRSRQSSRRGGSRGQSSNRKFARVRKLLIASVAMIVVAGASGHQVYHYANLPKADGRYCYAQAGQHHTAVFLDYSLTHELTEPQRRDMAIGLERAYEQTPPNGLISIFTTAKQIQASLARPVFQICKPASNPQELRTIDGVHSQTAPRLATIAKEAHTKYRGEIGRILSESADNQNASGDSPILEQLRAISRFDGFSSERRSLHVLTDGIQNSGIGHFCAIKGNMPSFARFEQKDNYQFVKPKSLAGTDVTLLLVEWGKFPNPIYQYCSNDEMRRWWSDYFRGNRANSVELTPLRIWAGS